MKVKISLGASMFPRIICGFPGVGKSTLFANSQGKITDSDSSKFDKSQFPQNYINHINQKLDEGYTVLCSTHKIVRDALVANGMDFVLVYPALNCRDEYIDRYINRGSPQPFIDMMKEKWVDFVVECSSQQNCLHVCLGQGQFLPSLEELPKLAM
jgi:hypothetical protein